MGKREVFAKNLRILTSLKGLKATTASRAIQAMLEDHANEQLRKATERTRHVVSEARAGIMKNQVDPKWYRRLMQRGVTRANNTTWRHMRRNRPLLWAGIRRVVGRRSFESPQLAISRLNGGPGSAITTQQLIELLDRGDGRYDYLRNLIESLYLEWQAKRLPKMSSRSRYMDDLTHCILTMIRFCAAREAFWHKTESVPR